MYMMYMYDIKTAGCCSQACTSTTVRMLEEGTRPVHAHIVCGREGKNLEGKARGVLHAELSELADEHVAAHAIGIERRRWHEAHLQIWLLSPCTTTQWRSRAEKWSVSCSPEREQCQHLFSLTQGLTPTDVSFVW